MKDGKRDRGVNNANMRLEKATYLDGNHNHFANFTLNNNILYTVNPFKQIIGFN